MYRQGYAAPLQALNGWGYRVDLSQLGLSDAEVLHLIEREWFEATLWGMPIRVPYYIPMPSQDIAWVVQNTIETGDKPSYIVDVSVKMDEWQPANRERGVGLVITVDEYGRNYEVAKMIEDIVHKSKAIWIMRQQL
jgi:hypothetical protein